MTPIEELVRAVIHLVRFYRTLDPQGEQYNSDLARHVRAVVAVWEKHPRADIAEALAELKAEQKRRAH